MHIRIPTKAGVSYISRVYINLRGGVVGNIPFNSGECFYNSHNVLKKGGPKPPMIIKKRVGDDIQWVGNVVHHPEYHRVLSAR